MGELDINPLLSASTQAGSAETTLHPNSVTPEITTINEITLLTEVSSGRSKIEDMKQAAGRGKKAPSIEEQLLAGKGPIKIEDLASQVGADPEVIRQVMEKLQKVGYGFVEADENIIRTTAPQEGGIFDHTRYFTRHIRIGVMGDTHLASKQERLEELEKMYDIYVREGIKHVYHAGDITEGYGVYRGQEFEVKHIGQPEQIQYAIDHYPKRKGVTTAFITGNHDLRMFERGGVDPGIPISQQRKDLDYLGQMTARVLLQPGIEMELLHPAGGMAYSLSYKAQRQIHGMAAEDLPDILVHGHYHSAFSMFYRGVNFIQSPCFKSSGLFEKRLGLSPVVGGWILDMWVDPKTQTLERFTPELFTFPKGKEKVIRGK